MALRGLFLAAQEACLIQQFRGYFPFNPSCGEQCQRVPLVNRPASLALLESVQYLLRRRQVRTMVIIDSADRPEEIAEIIRPLYLIRFGGWLREWARALPQGAVFAAPGSGGSGNALR